MDSTISDPPQKHLRGQLSENSAKISPMAVATAALPLPLLLLLLLLLPLLTEQEILFEPPPPPPPPPPLKPPPPPYSPSWTPDPAPSNPSQIYGWGQVQSSVWRILADDAHYGDRFGRTLVLHGNHLAVGADYSTCKDGAANPGGYCNEPGKGAVYIFEMDYVTSPYYRWSDTADTGTYGGYPDSNQEFTYCDGSGWNCITNKGFCTDCTNSSEDGRACTSSDPCPYNGTCRFTVPFTVRGSEFWGQRIKLQPSDLSDGDRFGASIDFDGETDTLVVGAPKQTVPGRCGTNYVFGVREGEAGDCSNGGAVYVFQKDFGGTNKWGQVAKFVTTP
eukprot:498477-Hanusia_phi.AAC.1